MQTIPRTGESELPVTLSTEHSAISVFDHLPDLQITETAYLVGSGINGKHQARRIPDNCWSVACNGAIRLPVQFNAWGAFDREVLVQPYIAAVPPDVTKIMGTSIGGAIADYVFDYAPGIEEARRLEYGLLLSGGTIAGCMLQLLYWAGVKRAVLCGVDMYGNRYCDGSASGYHRAGVDWGLQMRNMQTIIDLCIAGGMAVESMSKTALDVKLVQGAK